MKPAKNNSKLKEILSYTPVVAGAKKLMSNFAENAQPYGYDSPFSTVINAAILNSKNPIRKLEERHIQELDSIGEDSSVLKERIDMLNLLANKKQKHNSIPLANYRPSNEKDKSAKYYKSPSTEKQIDDYINTHWTAKNILSKKDLPKMRSGVLGNMKLDYGTDKQGNYISYYDKWDLNPIPQTGINWIDKTVDKVVTGVPNALGITNTPEVYGRVYLPNDMNKIKYADGGNFLSTNAGGISSLAGIDTDILDQTSFGKTRGGSTLSGAAKGAAAGAALGPWGMAGGAVLGGVGGLLKAGAEQKAQSEEDIAHRFRVNSLLAANLPGQPSYTPTFANGGLLMSLINDQKNTTYYPTGGKHSSNPHGGIPIGKDALAEQGEFRYDSKTKGSYIFSARF